MSGNGALPGVPADTAPIDYPFGVGRIATFAREAWEILP